MFVYATILILLSVSLPGCFSRRLEAKHGYGSYAMPGSYGYVIDLATKKQGHALRAPSVNVSCRELGVDGCVSATDNAVIFWTFLPGGNAVRMGMLLATTSGLVSLGLDPSRMLTIDLDTRRASSTFPSIEQPRLSLTKRLDHRFEFQFDLPVSAFAYGGKPLPDGELQSVYWAIIIDDLVIKGSFGATFFKKLQTGRVVLL